MRPDSDWHPRELTPAEEEDAYRADLEYDRMRDQDLMDLLRKHRDE